jgi:putative toxin-antitoxin system antitoxin component (TIGR02293 family)
VLERNIAAETGFFSRVSGKLGVRAARSGRDLVTLVEHRLPAESVRSLVRSGLTDEEAYRLIVPRRTLAHRFARRQPLSLEESDQALRVARTIAFSEQVFGETERAWRWLRKTKKQFEGKTPLEMLATEAGARLVGELIAQIDDGLAA